ncbi:MAG: hypothetical protein PHQ64_01240 [Bacilli bacterium]|nr:hypothetical protein [Bacilli bacterium]
MINLTNKGFLLVETLVVTVFVMGIFLFVYNNTVPMIAQLEKMSNYDDMESVYGAELIKNMVKGDNNFSSIISNLDEDTFYYDITDCTNYTDQEFCTNLKSSLKLLTTDTTVNGKTAYSDRIIITDYNIKKLQEEINKGNLFFTNRDRGLKEYITTLEDYSNDGSITVGNYRVIISRTTMDGNSFTKKYANIELIDNLEPVVPVVYGNGTAVYFNPVTGAKCTAGEAVSTTGTKTGCMKWYAFNDGGASTDTINLILDHNTTALVAWNSTGSNVSGPTNVMTQLQTDTSAWAGVPTRTDSYSVSNGTATYTINYSTYKARLIKASEIATITGNSSFVEATATYKSSFYLDSNNQTQTATTTGASNYDWLFDYTNGCTSYGCNIDDASNYGYWTSTAISGATSEAWAVSRGGNLGNSLVVRADSRGVRPVITLPKSML